MRPVFWFDTNSPYAYLAAQRVEAVLECEVDWRPIAFAFLLRAQGRTPWSFAEPTRTAGVAECEARAAARGLPPLRWPPGWPAGSYSLEPLRAITAAADHGRERQLALALLQANFATGEGLRDEGTIRRCWISVGLDPAIYAAQRDAAKASLAATTDGAIAAGVPGVPTVTVDGVHFWGDDRLPDAARAIAELDP